MLWTAAVVNTKAKVARTVHLIKTFMHLLLGGGCILMVHGLLEHAPLDLGQGMNGDERRLIEIVDDVHNPANLEPRHHAQERIFLILRPLIPPRPL